MFDSAENSQHSFEYTNKDLINIMKNTQYEVLNSSDIRLLKGVIKNRWRATIKRLAVTMLLPVVCVIGVSIFLNIIYLRARMPGKYGSGIYIDLIIPKSLNDLKLFGGLLIPGFILVSIANVWLFIITIPPAYIDLLKRRKQVTEFKPEQHMVVETNQYYLKTNVAAHPFFEVDFNTYCNIESTSSLIIETLPLTKIMLNIRTTDDNNIITL